LVVEAAWTVREMRTVPDRLERQVECTRRDLVARLDMAQTATNKQVDALRADLRREIDITRAGLLARVDAAADRVDSRAAELQQQAAEVMSRATDTASSAAALLEDARPAVQAWAKLSPALASNTLGLVAASKVAAGQAAQTMREIERATPDLLASVRVSALASQEAAQSAARTSQNLATLTAPGPKWLRYVGVGAAIAVPAAQVALPLTVLSK